MAKQIKSYMAKLVDIIPVADTNLNDWAWRCQYIGIEGVLILFESEHKRLGELFLKIVNRDGRHLKTSYGAVELFEDYLVFTTKQSKYKFLLIMNIEKAKSSGENIPMILL